MCPSASSPGNQLPPGLIRGESCRSTISLAAPFTPPSCILWRLSSQLATSSQDLCTHVDNGLNFLSTSDWLYKVAPARHITDQEWFQSQWWDKTLTWANIAFSTSCFWTACTSMMSTVRGLGSVESVGMEALNDSWISCLYTPSRRRGPPFTSTYYVLHFAVGQHHISITETMKFRTLQHLL